MERKPGEGERRRYSRVAIDRPATLVVGNWEQPVTVADISLKGALLQSDSPLPEPAGGGACQLHIELAPGADIRMTCELAHHEQDRMGLRCTHIDIDSIAHLRRLLELNLGDPELLNRELAELVR